MSKIGRKPIALGSVVVDVQGSVVHIKGSRQEQAHQLPDSLSVVLRDGLLLLVPVNADEKGSARRDLNRLWGLHRALLANKVKGAEVDFEKKMQIVGLGFKAALSGDSMIFSLGYSHKVNFTLPQGVSVEIDKSGQNLVFKSLDKELIGHVCSMVRSLRLPEPYKGTGIKLATEVIARKAGKAKSA